MSTKITPEEACSAYIEICYYLPEWVKTQPDLAQKANLVLAFINQEIDKQEQENNDEQKSL